MAEERMGSGSHGGDPARVAGARRSGGGRRPDDGRRREGERARVGGRGEILTESLPSPAHPLCTLDPPDRYYRPLTAVVPVRIELAPENDSTAWEQVPQVVLPVRGAGTTGLDFDNTFLLDLELVHRE